MILVNCAWRFILHYKTNSSINQGPIIIWYFSCIFHIVSHINKLRWILKFYIFEQICDSLSIKVWIVLDILQNLLLVRDLRPGTFATGYLSHYISYSVPAKIYLCVPAESFFLAALCSLCNAHRGGKVDFDKIFINVGDLCADNVEIKLWRYGDWETVSIEPSLQTKNGKVHFLHSNDTNVFWTALVRKAYLK